MTKARVLDLMALQEKARIAGTLADLRELARQKEEADRMVARLTEALERQGCETGVRLASEIMAERAMAAQLMAEAERQREKARALAARLADEQAKLAAQEQRHEKLTEKSVTERRAAATEKLAARESAMPPRRR